MKVITHEQATGLPEGTVFRSYEPIIFGELCVKHKPKSGSVFYSSSIAQAAFYARWRDHDFQPDPYGNTSHYPPEKDKDSYVVYTKEEVGQLVDILQKALAKRKELTKT